MIPTNDHFWSSRLLEHIQHLGLEDVVHGFDGDGRSGLRHGKDVDALRASEDSGVCVGGGVEKKEKKVSNAAQRARGRG